MPRSRRSIKRALGWEAAFLAVPVVALVGFGVLALGWEKRAEREELRARCRTLVEPLREDLRDGLVEKNVLAGLVASGDGAELPVPDDENAALRKKFAEGDYSGVLGGPSSRSAAGLPLRPLAAVRLLREETDRERLEELCEVILAEPSLLTPRLLEAAEARHSELAFSLPAVLEGWKERLQLEEGVRALLEREGSSILPESQMFRWIVHEDQMWLALREGRDVLLVEKEQVNEVVARIVHSVEGSLPDGVAIEVLLRGPSRDRRVRR